MANSVGGGTWLRRSCFWRMQGSGVMGRSLPSSPRATWLTLDFPARCAAGSRQQDASPGRVPVLGPLLLHAGLAPSCPHRPRPPPLCQPMPAPRPPLSRKDWVPSLSQHPHYQDGLPQTPCPVHPRPQDEPRESRVSTPVLCTRPGREGRGLGPHSRTWPGPAWSQSPEKKRRGAFPHQDRGRTCGLGARPTLSSPLPGRLRSSSCPLWPMVTCSRGCGWAPGWAQGSSSHRG